MMRPPNEYYVKDCEQISNIDTALSTPLITTAIMMWNSWDLKSSTRSPLGWSRSSSIAWSRCLNRYSTWG